MELEKELRLEQKHFAFWRLRAPHPVFWASACKVLRHWRAQPGTWGMPWEETVLATKAMRAVEKNFIFVNVCFGAD